MYKAVFVELTTLGEAADQIKPFIMFDAKRREIELKDNDKLVILRGYTSLSYISIPLGYGLTLNAVEKELSEIETVLDPDARGHLSQLLDNE